jgi:hypothetical protein
MGLFDFFSRKIGPFSDLLSSASKGDFLQRIAGECKSLNETALVFFKVAPKDGQYFAATEHNGINGALTALEGKFQEHFHAIEKRMESLRKCCETLSGEEGAIQKLGLVEKEVSVLSQVLNDLTFHFDLFEKLVIKFRAKDDSRPWKEVADELLKAEIQKTHVSNQALSGKLKGLEDKEKEARDKAVAAGKKADRLKYVVDRLGEIEIEGESLDSQLQRLNPSDTDFEKKKTDIIARGKALEAEIERLRMERTGESEIR